MSIKTAVTSGTTKCVYWLLDTQSAKVLWRYNTWDMNSLQFMLQNTKKSQQNQGEFHNLQLHLTCLQHIANNTTYRTCDMEHVTHATYGTCDMQHVTHATCCTCDMWHATYATCNMSWHVTCYMQHVTCDLWHSTCNMWHATYAT